MGRDQVTYPSNSLYCYAAEAETVLQEELKLLADIEARYEEERQVTAIDAPGSRQGPHFPTARDRTGLAPRSARAAACTAP